MPFTNEGMAAYRLSPGVCSSYQSTVLVGVGWEARGLYITQTLGKALITSSFSEATSLKGLSLGAFRFLVLPLWSGPGQSRACFLLQLCA